MIAKAAVISHGANAVRYATEKDKSEIVKLNRLPDGVPPEGIWQRMVIHQKQFEDKLNRYRPMKNNAIRIEVSPAREESDGWTHADWKRLADDFIREFDAVDLSKRPRKCGMDQPRRQSVCSGTPPRQPLGNRPPAHRRQPRRQGG